MTLANRRLTGLPWMTADGGWERMVPNLGEARNKRQTKNSEVCPVRWPTISTFCDAIRADVLAARLIIGSTEPDVLITEGGLRHLGRGLINE